MLAVDFQTVNLWFAFTMRIVGVRRFPAGSDGRNLEDAASQRDRLSRRR